MATSEKQRGESPSSIRVLWVDPGIGEVGSHTSIKQRFESLSPSIDQWLYFTSAEEFTSSLQKSDNVTLICVMSGYMSRVLVPEHSSHRSIHAIYVFCADLGRAREAMVDQAKVKGVFNVEDDLYEQLTDDLVKLLVERGIRLAQADERRLARADYDEAQRLLRAPTNRVAESEKKSRLQEIDVRMDQLLA